jgi:hypothetical protein
MSDYREAAAAAGKLTGFIEMLERVRKVVATAAQFEQEEQAAKDRVTAAKAEATKAEADKAEALKGLEAAQQQVIVAQEQVKAVAHEADQNATRIIAKANEDAAKITSAAQSKLAAARHEGETIAKQRAELQAQLDAAHADLAILQDKIEAAKADARARFG